MTWFKTSSNQGSIVGFGNNQTTPASDTANDRILWIDPTGHLVWAVYNTSTGNQELTSGSTYANGAWHFVAASVGGAGQKLYVDGSLAASSGNTVAQSYSGWWDIGLSAAVSGGGWTDAPASAYFNGSIAQLAIIPSQLTSGQVSTLYTDNTLSTYTAGVNALSPANYWALNDSGSVPTRDQSRELRHRRLWPTPPATPTPARHRVGLPWGRPVLRRSPATRSP